MSALGLLQLLGYGLGTALHVALLRLVTRRRDRRPGEGLLLLLALALLVWNAASLLEAALPILLRRETPGAKRLLDAVAVGAAAFVPSLVV
ncbi:MAG: hypothetical protein ACYTFT_13795, partial [Planctomycetota bacterium]